MKRKNQWKKSLALGLFLGAATLATPSVVLAEQVIIYDDGESHKEDHDFSEVIDESVRFEINSGSTSEGVILGGPNGLDIQMDNGHRIGVLETNIGDENAGGYVNLNMMNGSTWAGDVQLSTTTNSYLQFNTTMADSVFDGSIQGDNSKVGMSLQNSQWTGDLDLHSTKVDTETSAYISLQDHSVWRGDLSFSNDGEVQVTVDHSQWVGDFDKKVTEKLGDHLGSHFVNLQNGKWDGNYRLNVQVDGIVPGYNQVTLSEQSEWNGDYESKNVANNEQVLNNQVVVNDGSSWNGNMVVAGSSVGTVYLNEGGNWQGDFDGTQMSLPEAYGNYGGSIGLYGDSTWTGMVKANTQNTPEVNLAYGSNWKMTGDSTIKALYLDETSAMSFVDSPLSRAGGYSTLTITENLNGTEGARINLRTNLSQNVGDLLDVKGEVVGNILVGVNNQGGARVDPSRELTIIKTGSSAEDAFTLAHEVEVGGFKYLMKQEGTDWVLYSMDRLPGGGSSLTSSGSGAVNTLSAGYLLSYAENESVLKRTGELREGVAVQSMWGRIYGGEFSSSATGYVGSYDMNYQGVQVGADKKIALGDRKGDLYLGALAGYSKGSLDYKNGSGSIDSKTLGVYGTYVAPNDFYSNLVLKYGWTKSDFSVRDSAGDLVTGKGLKSDGLSASIEIGKKIHFDKKTNSGWYVEPQAQLTHGMRGGSKMTASNGLAVDLDGYQSLQGRLGMRAGYEVKAGENPINVYGKLSYVHEFDGKMDVALNGVNIKEDLGDSWWNYGVGVTARVGDRHNVYLEVEKSSGDRFNQKWGISGGYRVAW